MKLLTVARRQGHKMQNRLSSEVDWKAVCRCGHARSEHHSSFGCMQWDERRTTGWCGCDGFVPCDRFRLV